MRRSNPTGTSRRGVAYVAAASYGGKARETAYSLKAGDPVAVRAAAARMAAAVSPDDVLVPVPSSKGSRDDTLTLAEAIANVVGCRVADVLRRREPVESLHSLRHAGRWVEGDHDIYAVGKLPPHGDVWLIDNVVTSGGTLAACRNALGGAGAGLVYADATARTGHRRENPSGGARAFARELEARYGVTLHMSEGYDPEVVTVESIKVPESARGRGVARRVMEDVVAWADANGIVLSLTPAADYGSSVTRLRAFYKSLGFVDNKGRAKDYRTQDTMVRPPARGRRENPDSRIMRKLEMLLNDPTLKKVYITLESDYDGERYRLFFSDRKGQRISEPLNGFVGFRQTWSHHKPCSHAYEVAYTEATKGWGPLLYEIALEVAGPAGLMSDREQVSPSALRVWQEFEQRADVEHTQLDVMLASQAWRNLEPPVQLTPDILEDDCEQMSAVHYAGRDGWPSSPLSKRYVKANDEVLRALRKRKRLIVRKL